MCGIAGVAGGSNVVREPVLKKMAQSLAHRGPDDEGIEILPVNKDKNSYLGLVHRRLSIIDLSNTAHQPMKDEDTGNYIVYGGEIYNYREIRKLLEEKGNIFKSNSDTEVILKAYAVYGEKCLEKFRGMFAFAIWDERKKSLFLAVDRFGIKPLYFCPKDDELFLFSSEVRTILNSGLIKKEIEPLAVDSFLAYGAVQSPLTIIKGVYALLPGHYLIHNIQNDETKISRYWGLNKSLVSEGEKQVSDVKEVLKESIKAHLISDVPVGLFLSGGVDSSAIAILASEVCKGNGLQSFSITFPEKEYSEEGYSKLIGNKFCSNHNEIQISEADLYSLLPQAIEAMDQPTVDGINTYVISGAVRERGIKTVLSGQGGDEVFGGYNTFRRIPLFRKLNRVPHSMRIKIAEMIRKISKESIFNSKFTQVMQSDGDVFSLYLILRQLFNPETRKKLTQNFEEEKLSDGLPTETKEWLFGEIQGLGLFSTISTLEMRSYLANTLLRDGDVMGMAHGLEVRVPFIDHELVKCVFNIPVHEKVNNRIPKQLLVETVRNELPQEIYLRPKMGFTFPWEIWLRNKLRVQVEELLDNFPINNKIGLNIKACRNVWDRFLQRKPDVTWSRVWAIYVLLSWCRKNVSIR